MDQNLQPTPHSATGGLMLCVQKHRAGSIWCSANTDIRTIVRRAFVVILFTVVSLMEERRTGLTEQIP